MTFSGITYSAPRDGARLRRQLGIVKSIMSDGQPHTLDELSKAAACSVASASARVRDLRKAKFGAYLIGRTYISHGLWTYRMLTGPSVAVQGVVA